jgi:hypothetical protein
MRATASAIFALLIAGAIGGCKKDGMTAQRDLADDIDAIETALNDSDRELTREGVVVAYRSTPGVHAEPGAPEQTTPTLPETPDPDVGDEPVAPPEPAPDFSGDDAPPVNASPPEEDEPRALSARDHESIEREKSPRRNRRAKMARSAPPTRCERLCGLAQSTCDLRDRICRMAERHFGDIRYATSCQRAEDQCDAVRSQCESCAA